MAKTSFEMKELSADLGFIRTDIQEAFSRGQVSLDEFHGILGKLSKYERKLYELSIDVEHLEGKQ